MLRPLRAAPTGRSTTWPWARGSPSAALLPVSVGLTAFGPALGVALFSLGAQRGGSRGAARGGGGRLGVRPAPAGRGDVADASVLRPGRRTLPTVIMVVMTTVRVPLRC